MQSSIYPRAYRLFYVPVHRPQRQSVWLTGARDITHDMREFSLRALTPATFRAGQYAMLHLAGMPPRAYSMSNTANADGLWQFMVRRTPNGVVSNALFALPPGSALELDGPYGLAWLREDGPRDIVCIAGGSGIAPMVAILDAAAMHDEVRQRAAWLFYGGRGPADFQAIADLLKPHALERGLEWHPVVSVPALAAGTGWRGGGGFGRRLLARRAGRWRGAPAGGERSVSCTNCCRKN